MDSPLFSDVQCIYGSCDSTLPHETQCIPTMEEMTRQEMHYTSLISALSYRYIVEEESVINDCEQ